MKGTASIAVSVELLSEIDKYLKEHEPKTSFSEFCEEALRKEYAKRVRQLQSGKTGEQA